MDTDERLRSEGWTVLRYWEHDAVEKIVTHVLTLTKKQRDRREGAAIAYE